ncbi:Ribonuclease HIII [Candidatus Clavichlamydia salmonicola]|uniref:ribonuclease HIII n=1 Tax=Candidatus Clavichlamydia salmonicola TaxID=469812 RepID=UPI001891369B|nr:ribonuclease HIII [Candidatus Clavichlamydia salmonicola]MBF5050953.1 Ribonuclease HIII [Candidatus Clavichlamydia salmonicola]
MSIPYVATLDPSLFQLLEEEMKKQGFTFSQPAYTCFQASKTHLSCTLYKSGKLVVQGKEKDDFIKYFLEPAILKNFSYGYENTEMVQDNRTRIGTDESGKGDFFGALCIAGVTATEEQIKQLCSWGVKDSKKLKDTEIISLSKKIRSLCNFEVICLKPEKYNQLYQSFKNLNLLMGWGHATVIDNLHRKTNIDLAIVDKFANDDIILNALKQKKISISIEQKVRAESDPVVAAASVLARAGFIENISFLEKQYNVILPKGAGTITFKAAIKIAQNFGLDLLSKVCKVHFKTYEEVRVQLKGIIS